MEDIYKIIIIIILIINIFIISINYYEKYTAIDFNNLTDEQKKLLQDAVKEQQSDIRYLASTDIEAILNVSNIVKNGTIPIPKGTIVAYYSTQVPQGWALCDGRTVNGLKTPDLRGRFIMGVTNQNGFRINNTGGSKKINRNNLPNFQINTNNDGRHTHNMLYKWKDNYYERKYAENRQNAFGPVGAHSQAGNQGSYTRIMDEMKNKSEHSHKINFTGGNHDYLQPYYALIYIMKV